MKKILKWIIPAVVILTIVFTVLDFINTAGDTGDPDAQLASMLPGERQFCEQVLWQIDSSSTERDVLALLGKPSRSLKFKKNWWVGLDEIGGHLTGFRLHVGGNSTIWERGTETSFESRALSSRS